MAVLLHLRQHLNNHRASIFYVEGHAVAREHGHAHERTAFRRQDDDTSLSVIPEHRCFENVHLHFTAVPQSRSCRTGEWQGEVSDDLCW